MNTIRLNTGTLLTFVLSVFVFILLVDPTNSILKLKDIVFILLLALSTLIYSRIKINTILLILLIYIIILVSFISGYIAVYSFDYSFTFSIIKGFTPLILLFWIDKYKILKKLIFPSVVICIIVILTFFVFKYLPQFSNALYNYFMSHNATLMIGIRSFLGIEIMSLFYKSLPVLLVPASIYTYRFFNTKSDTLENFLMMSLLLITLFLGGTRACILGEIIIVAFNFFLWLSKSNLGKVVMIPILAASITIFGILLLSLISEKEEESNKIKFANLDSYSELLVDHPSILLFGQGAGSLFYSKGRNAMVAQTEWSYIEIIRMFGLLGAFFVISLFFFPLHIIYKKRKVLKYWIPVFVGYLLYLFVGGTNPLLLGSTGMLVLLGAYSYSLNPYYELNEW